MLPFSCAGFIASPFHAILSISLTFHPNLIHVLHLIASYTQKYQKKMNFIWWKVQSQTNDRQAGKQSQSDYCCFLLLDNRKVLKKMNKNKKFGNGCYFYVTYYLYSSDMNESSGVEWQKLPIYLHINVIEIKMMSHIRSKP